MVPKDLFRVEHSFKPGRVERSACGVYSDVFFAGPYESRCCPRTILYGSNDSQNHPTWQHETGEPPETNLWFGFSDLEQLRAWFPPGWRAMLLEYAYVVRLYQGAIRSTTRQAVIDADQPVVCLGEVYNALIG